MIDRMFKYFDGQHAGGQTDKGITKEEWVTGFATFIKGGPSYIVKGHSSKVHCHQKETFN